MRLPLVPPVEPQLARSGKELPVGDRWAYEPKWDGFRVIAFVDGDDRYLQSRGRRPLSRYFPEVTLPAGRYVLDGELVILDAAGGQDFEALQQRIHPADSRIRRLAAETPTRLVAFDLLVADGEPLLERPFSERREALAAFVAGFDGDHPLDLTPHVRDPDEAAPWLRHGEGVVAKAVDAPYRAGERVAEMVKVKRVRTIDAVVLGWRPGKHPGTVGSLILALYGGDGELHVVGHVSGLAAREKRELVGRLQPHETGEHGSADPSRWASDRELEWRALRPELVVEVAFDHVSGRRIRHGATIVRWREDKDPRECVIGQLDG